MSVSTMAIQMAEIQPKRPRAARRKAASKLVQAQPSSSCRLPLALGAAVRGQRLAQGLTIEDAAALCGVGGRFLIDLEMGKPSLQLELASSVAARFGVDLSVATRPAPRIAANGGQVQTVCAPADCPNPAAWLALWHAGLYVASGVRLPVSECSPIRGDRGELVALGIAVGGADDTPSQAFRALLDRAAPAAEAPLPVLLAPWREQPPLHWHEQHRGPGLPDAFNFMRDHSASPLRDIEVVLRWAVVSTVLLDRTVHLGRLPVVHAHGSSDERWVQIAPLRELQVASGRFFQKRWAGLRIGNVWPDEVPRDGHWKRVAEAAGVHPKVVFQMMREVSARVPGLLDEALISSLGSMPRSGVLIEVIKDVRAAATRMGDLALLAARDVSGLKTRKQPKVEPVATKVVIQPKPRFIPTADFED